MDHRENRQGPVRINVVMGKKSEAIRQQRYEDALARIAKRIQNDPFSEEEILAEVQVFRADK